MLSLSFLTLLAGALVALAEGVVAVAPPCEQWLVAGAVARPARCPGQ